jgi:hypothetical protein
MSFLISLRLPFILINLNESSAVIIFKLSLVIELLKAGPSKTSMVSLGDFKILYFSVSGLKYENSTSSIGKLP